MIAVSSLDIARSPTEVYAFFVDQDNWAVLDPATLDITPRGKVVASFPRPRCRLHRGLQGLVLCTALLDLS